MKLVSRDRARDSEWGGTRQNCTDVFRFGVVGFFSRWEDVTALAAGLLSTFTWPWHVVCGGGRLEHNLLTSSTEQHERPICLPAAQFEQFFLVRPSKQISVLVELR